MCKSKGRVEERERGVAGKLLHRRTARAPLELQLPVWLRAMSEVKATCCCYYCLRQLEKLPEYGCVLNTMLMFVFGGEPVFFPSGGVSRIDTRRNC